MEFNDLTKYSEEELRKLDLINQILWDEKTRDLDGLQKLNTLEARKAELSVLEREVRLAPHMVYGTRISYDTTEKQYRCELPIYKTTMDYEEEEESDFLEPFTLQPIVAYGDTPSQACDNFDNLWNHGATNVD